MSAGLFDLAPVAAHPAKFSDALLPVIAGYLKGYRRVLDPMAGVGTLARSLYERGWTPGAVWSNDLESEWANQCPLPRSWYDARALPFQDGEFDAIATSPTYGNRMADHHNARDGSKRHTYRHYLGRPLTPGNTGQLQWGREYQDTHEAIIAECVRVLRPGGRVVWNVKDHVRKGKVVYVSSWHIWALRYAGLRPVKVESVDCPGQRHGQNGQARVDHEWVLVFDKPGGAT